SLAFQRSVLSRRAALVRQCAPCCPLSFLFSIRGLMALLTDILRQIPFAYRVEQGYTHLGNQERVYEQTDRLGPGHTGSAYPENSGVRAAPRLGNRAAVETGLRRRPAGQRRVALPCPA